MASETPERTRTLAAVVASPQSWEAVPPPTGSVIDGPAHPLALRFWALLRDRSIADKMLVLSACDRRLGMGELSVKQEQAYNAVLFFVGEVGHVPHANEYDWWRKHTPERAHFPSATFVRNAFGGSWPAVRALFGAEPKADARVLRLTARGPAFSNEELYGVLSAWAEDYSRTLDRHALQEWLHSERPAAVGLVRWPRGGQTFKRLGSLRESLIAAGVEDLERIRGRGRPRRFSSSADETAMRRKLVAGIADWASSTPGVLRQSDFMVWLSQLPEQHPLHGLRDVRVVLRNVFGSWADTLQEAGFSRRGAGRRGGHASGSHGSAPLEGPLRAPRVQNRDWEALACWVRLAAQSGFGPLMSQPQYDGWRRERLERAHRAGRPLEAIPCSDTLAQRAGSWFTVKTRAGVPGADQYASERRNRLSYTEREVKDAVRAAAAELELELVAPDEHADPDRTLRPLRPTDYQRWRAAQVAEAHAAGEEARLPSREHVSRTLGGPHRDWREVLKAAREAAPAFGEKGGDE